MPNKKNNGFKQKYGVDMKTVVYILNMVLNYLGKMYADTQEKE